MFPGTKRGQSGKKTRPISFPTPGEAVGFRFPAHLQSSPQLFVGHVEVSLCLLNARMSEHQLNDPDVDAIREQSTRAFVAQVVPAEIDPFELLSIPLVAPLGN